MKILEEKIQNFEARIKFLEDNLKLQKDITFKLLDRIRRLEEASGIFDSSKYLQETARKNISSRPADSNFFSPYSAEKITSAPLARKIVSPSPSKKNISHSSANNLTAEFNSLASQGGFDFKKSRDEFLHKYKVRAFSCTNFEARMNEPVPPPEFFEVSVVLSGDYWAINLKDNLFAVFPNIKIYSDNYHTARAMGNVFESNFVAGMTYNKIFVVNPAVFSCSGNVWSLINKGKLNLT